MTTFTEAQHPRSTDGTFAEKPLSTPEISLGRDPSAPNHTLPPHARANVLAKLAELDMDEALIMVPEGGFQDGYYDVVAYDGGEGRIAKFTVTEDGNLEHIL